MSPRYTRIAAVPRGSFFLFGPRGIGKSTWARERLGGARRFDLLDEGYFQAPRYSTTMLAGLRAIGELGSIVRRILVYGGSRSLRTSEGIDVLPVGRFAEEVAGGSLWPD